MKTELDINIKNTIFGCMVVGMILLTIIEIITYEDNTDMDVLIGIGTVALLSVGLVLYWIVVIYLFTAFLTIGNDIGTYIINKTIRK